MSIGHFHAHLISAASLTYAPQPNKGGIVTTNVNVHIIAIATAESTVLSLYVEKCEVTAVYHSNDNKANVVTELIPVVKQREINVAFFRDSTIDVVIKM